MEKHERKPKGVGRNGRRKYEPPEILSQKVFETTALACGKLPGGGGKCNSKPSAS
jgi:hypothetical protein